MSIAELVTFAETAPPTQRELDLRNDLLCVLEDLFEEGMQPCHFGCVASEVKPKHWHSSLSGPLREFVDRPGKGFRSAFMRVCWESLENGAPMPSELPVLVEALHAGSLIIDDIEDGAVERRGRPALHHIYGMDIALNAGNWLYFVPGTIVPRLNLDHLSELELHRRINTTLFRAHAGQALDLGGHPTELRQLEIPAYVAAMTRLKTGELFAFAASSAAIVSSAPREHERALQRFGRELGVALQMLDDLSTVSNPDRREKASEDFRNARVTWLWAWAADALSGTKFQHLVQEVALPASAERNADLCERFRDLCAVVGRQHVCEQVARAWDAPPSELSNHRAMIRFHDDIVKLEKSYG